MYGYNKSTFVGTLIKDPELKHGPDGKPLAAYILDVPRKFPKNEGPKSDKFRTFSFGRQAKNDAEYLKKGSLVLVEGRIEFKNYTDKDGIERQTINLLAEDVRYWGNPKTKEKAPEGYPNDEHLPF